MKKYGLLILSSNASSVYIDNNKNFVSKENISGLDCNGNILERFQSTLNISQKFEEMSEQDALNLIVPRYITLKERL